MGRAVNEPSLVSRYAVPMEQDIRKRKRITKRDVLEQLDKGGWDTRSLARLNIATLIHILILAPINDLKDL